MKNLIKNIIATIFPSHCLTCEDIISKDALFCNTCWPKLQFITEPKCRICSYPFEIPIEENNPYMPCASCLKKKPSYDKSVTIFRYNDLMKKIIADLKYKDKTYIAKKFAKMLYDRVLPELEKVDLITIAPLHKNRLKDRKFNQAALIARNLKKLIPHKKYILDLLFKVNNTKSQVELNKKQRVKNLKRAFILNKKYKNYLENKTILIIDDVITTGATLENCAKVLKKKGAKKVIILTIAKTVFSKSIIS